MNFCNASVARASSSSMSGASQSCNTSPHMGSRSAVNVSPHNANCTGSTVASPRACAKARRAASKSSKGMVDQTRPLEFGNTLKGARPDGFSTLNVTGMSALFGAF
jgi:hypothetical protein